MSLNTPSGFSSNCDGVSNSTSFPSSKTMMRSLSMTVCKRCAIVSTVQFWN